MAKSMLWGKLLFFAFIGLIFFPLFYKQINFCQGSISGHIREHIELTVVWLKGGYYLPHPGFQISIFLVSSLLNLTLEDSTAVVLTLCVLSVSILVYVILSSSLKDLYSGGFLLVLTAVLMIVTAIYLPWFNKNLYLGQGSPNLWHSPTLLAVKPFAFLCVLLFIYSTENRRFRGSAWYRALFSMMLLLSVLAKPFFALVFIPAAIVYMIVKHSRDYGLCLKLFVTMLPAFTVLALQAFNTLSRRVGGGYTSKVVLDFFGVWRYYTPNVPISIILATAFPLAVVASNPKRAAKNSFLMLSWMMLFVGVLEFGLLAEEGGYYTAANWSWGYNIALNVLFVFSSAEFFSSFKISGKKNTLAKAAVYLTITLFLLHAVSGLLYFTRILNCGSWV